MGSSSTHGLCLATVLVGAALGAAGPARADAMLTRGGSEGLRLFPQQVSIGVEVLAQVEMTAITLDFAQAIESGDWVLAVPSPAGAYVVDLEIDAGEGWQPAAMVVEAPPAAAGGGAADAALVEWLGDTPLTANLSLTASSTLRLRVRFQRLLRRYLGEVELDVGAERCPLRPDDDPGALLSLDVTVKTLRPLSRFEVEGLPAVRIARGEQQAGLRLEPVPLAQTLRAVLSYAEETSGVAVNFLAHRTPTADPLGGDEGYFMLLVDVDTVEAIATRPRSVALVVDKSGSMSGDKIEQARAASLAMLGTLRGDDTFNVHVFDSLVYTLFDRPRVADEDSVVQARRFIEAVTAGGSTNLNDAMLAGLGGRVPEQGHGEGGLAAGQGGCGYQAGPSVEHDAKVAALDSYTPPPEDVDNASMRYDALVLLSDGLPSAGVTQPEAILQNVRDFNVWDSRIFTVAVGAGADVPLLESLARDARGYNIVLNARQAERRLAEVARRLFQDIEAVRVTDIDLVLDDINPSEQLPEQAPDLFNGGQVLLVGRYATPGSAALKISGDDGAGVQDWSQTVQAPALEAGNAFIKHVWATQKVGALLAELARGGNEEELRARITELGLAYRIQTPYTSFSYQGTDAGSSGGSMADCGCALAALRAQHNAAVLLVLGLLLLGGLRRKRQL